jgi:hypothetical protein
LQEATRKLIKGLTEVNDKMKAAMADDPTAQFLSKTEESIASLEQVMEKIGKLDPAVASYLLSKLADEGLFLPGLGPTEARKLADESIELRSELYNDLEWWKEQEAQALDIKNNLNFGAAVVSELMEEALGSLGYRAGMTIEINLLLDIINKQINRIGSNQNTRRKAMNRKNRVSDFSHESLKPFAFRIQKSDAWRPFDTVRRAADGFEGRCNAIHRSQSLDQRFLE